MKIFSEKIDFKSVGPRIDARSKSPRKSPPSSIQSPGLYNHFFILQLENRVLFPDINFVKLCLCLNFHGNF